MCTPENLDARLRICERRLNELSSDAEAPWCRHRDGDIIDMNWGTMDGMYRFLIDRSECMGDEVRVAFSYTPHLGVPEVQTIMLPRKQWRELENVLRRYPR